jgi:hypothetical protein
MLTNAWYSEESLVCYLQNITLPVLLYRCETWSVTLRAEQIRMVENRVLMRITEEEVTDKKIHEELRNLYSSPVG